MKHGLSRTETPTFDSWNSMMFRCYNPNSGNYSIYGALGVDVCEFLREGPQNLIKLIGIRPTDKTIDRFPEKEGGYWCGSCPDCTARGRKLNVRWATTQEQNRNRLDNRKITAMGQIKLLCEWAEELEVSPGAIRYRIDTLGWSPDKALSVPFSGRAAGERQANNKSGFKGVIFSLVRGRFRYWKAQVVKEGKLVFSKTFSCRKGEEGAWRAAAKAVNETYVTHYPELPIPNPDWETRPYPNGVSDEAAV